MNYTYRLHPLIKKDYDDAYGWYEDKQKGLGERFIKSVRKKSTSVPYITQKNIREKNIEEDNHPDSLTQVW